MAVDFKTFISVVPHVTAVRKPVLVRGRHGVGKSQVVYQFAGHAGLPVVERRASQMTEGDLLGLPSTDGNVTSWNPPEWFKTACETPVVLFLDEVDRATPEVRQGIFELTDSRKLAGFTLHPETLIFAAVNGGEHGEQYQVGEMDPAELDRWTVFDESLPLKTGSAGQRTTFTRLSGTSLTRTTNTLSTLMTLSLTRFILRVGLGIG